MELSQFVQNLLNGVSIGSVYAIFALGYTLIFSILGIINFAHGAVFTLGAYFTYALAVGEFGIGGRLANVNLFPGGSPLGSSVPGFLVALLVGSVLAGLASVLIERLAFRPLRRRHADPLLALVSSLGVALVLVNLIQYVFGSENYSFPDTIYGNLKPAVLFSVAGAFVGIQTKKIIIIVVSLVILLILGYLVGYTKIGKALRAVAESPTTASLLGINVDRYILFTFFLSGFLGGLAGILVATNFAATPYFGVAYGLKGLAVIVLGGLGSIPGAVLGGLVIGLAEAFLPALFPEYNAYKDAFAFLILFGILLIRPQGLLGRSAIQKV